ncbi:MAG TPA: glycosyltransferase [Deltaproteobacteria bacterium]|nr:glycosyltransferase [Deltaproteobacteria bacterium]
MVSIIICFYERLRHLKCCLDSLKFSVDDFDEIIITDDGSSEETVSSLKKMISSYNFPIRHVWQEKKGFRLAASRNNGIRAAKGDYLIFLDCDFAILPGTIREHLRAAKRGRFVAGLCKYLPENETKNLFQQELRPDSLVSLYASLSERPITREHLKFIKYSILRRLHLVGPRKPQCSSHFSIHRKDMEYVNGYDENFVGWGGEDEDLSMRFLNAGIQGYSAISKAKVLHLWHPQELGGKHWREGPNVNYLYRKDIPFKCENGLLKL